GRWAHPLRRTHPGAVVLSVCGFPEMSAFNALSHYANFLFEEQEKGRLWAQIYRPAAEFMYRNVEKQRDILNATRQAGRELVETHRVSPRTLSRIEQPLADNFSDFAKITNCMWGTCIAEGITKKEFEKEDMIPRADSIETFMLLLPMGFNPERAGTTQATLQFEFTGSVEGSCHFIISEGTIKAKEGKSQMPDLVINTPFDVWMDIQTGKADGGQMYMEEKYKAEGDMDLFLNMSQFFLKED
ncbi:MAG: SCP2 sterol-binding domain-containing protein, partial [Desulfotignum sp.]|nr:SCP2 sterol-binding domain-containing protein [Desulfotignum sp.]